MTLQLSETVRNARLDAIETAIGASAIMHLRSGTPPADTSQANSGTLIATLNLPADWLAAAASGQKAKAGTWEDPSADAAGTVGHFRIFDSGGTTCHMQGTVSGSGGGGDMELDNVVVEAGQQITITSFQLTDGNA